MNKKPKTPVEEAKDIVEQYTLLETQVKGLEETNKKLVAENKRIQEEIKKYEPYQDLIDEEIPQTWDIELKDKNIIGALRRLEVKIHTPGASVKDGEEQDTTSIRAGRINRVVEKMIWYVTNNSARKNDFIKRAFRGEEE